MSVKPCCCHTRASDIPCPIPIATLLAEVEAKRHILAMYEDYTAERRHLAPVIWELAQPYAGQDGWREEWAL